MDTMITSPETAGETAVTETPGQTPGTEHADSGKDVSEGGESQGSAEGNQEQSGGRRKWSMQDEVKELRAQRRELREQLNSFGSVREELAALREEMNRQRQSGPAKAPSNFWQDPDGTLDSKLDERIERLQNNMLERFEMTREQEVARQAHVQEVASSTEFIRSQQGYDPSDDEDLVEIIDAMPKKTRENSDPQTIAEYAWYKLQAQRGVGNKTLAKSRASSVQGQPPGVGFGRKVWSKTEFDAACDLLEKSSSSATDPKNAELLKELESAHKEGRVR